MSSNCEGSSSQIEGNITIVAIANQIEGTITSDVTASQMVVAVNESVSVASNSTPSTSSIPSDVNLSGNNFMTPIPTYERVGPRLYLPPCPAELKPVLEQTFVTLDEAEAFYERYASYCGFTSRYGTTKTLRGCQTFRLRNMLCNKAGFREEPKHQKKTNRVTMITRQGCDAKVQFTLVKETGLYKVNRFVEGHNHNLASPDSMIHMKQKRKMTAVQKAFVAKAARLKLGGVKAFRGWKELSGSYKNVGASEMDFKNFIRDLKKFIGDNDGQMFIENFIRKKGICSSFYFDFQVDESNKLCRVFWADTISRKNYALFGEMMSVDATYSTNKYNMIFVPFTGVDNHKKCITFAAGFLAHENSESYSWLLRSFLEAMGNCHPKVIISDQDPGLKNAIKEVMPQTKHRLCMWHIMKKLREKVDASLWQDEDFKKRLNCCVWNNYLEAEEFEENWANIMIDYNLIDHPWFSDLFDMRETWIPAYFKDIFMGGLMRVTSRSESENSFFDRFVTPNVTLVEFWMCFESAMDAQRHKQSKLNTANKHSDPPLGTPLSLEKHASEVYTHCIFKEFQKEITSALFDCGMADMEKTGESVVYIINDDKWENKTWKVTYKGSNAETTCTCCLFQRMGVLCRHVLWVFKTKKIQRIPEQYIVHRWSKDAMNKPIFDNLGNLLGDALEETDKKKLIEALWEEVYTCVSIAEDNDEHVQLLIEKLRDIKLEMQQKGSTPRKGRDKDSDMAKYVGCSIPTEVTILPPKKSFTKGSGKRIESGVLKALEKHAHKQRFCKICGGRGHDSRNCKSKEKQTGHAPTVTTTVSKPPRCCKRCGGIGHDARTCASILQDEVVEDINEEDHSRNSKSNEKGKETIAGRLRPKSCKRCGAKGHDSRSCTTDLGDEDDDDDDDEDEEDGDSEDED